MAPTQDNPDIVVVADSGERPSIDRTTYAIRDNAEARSSSTLDLLAQVPLVEVRPDGQLRLLGRSGVTILIDGKDVADPVTFLRNLQGSQVAKIEVISNPSAQFSARGTAGIINIVTRRSFAQGAGGSLTANVGSFGNAGLKMSPNWARGPLAFSGSVGLARWVAPGGFERQIYSVRADGHLLAESSENTRYRNRNDTVSGNFLFSYKPDPKQSLGMTGSLQITGGHPSRSSEIVFAGLANSGRRLAAWGNVANSYGDISADYRRDGNRQGEQLTVSGGVSVSRVNVQDRFFEGDRVGEESDFIIRNHNHSSTATVKLDYVRPFGAKRRLSFGVKAEHVRSDILSEYSVDNLNHATLLSIGSKIDGSWVEKSAYLTYQAPFSGGTLLAGLRVEGRHYGFPEKVALRGLNRSQVFPSLHYERRLAKWLTADLSYSRRIAWPGIEALNPALRLLNPTTASAGNPDLRPELTDSYEAKLASHFSNQEIDLTAFLRHTTDVLSNLADLNGDGVLVTVPVNLGTRSLRGVSLSMRGPLTGGFRYNFSANLADQSFSHGEANVPLSQTGAEYGASARIEYRDGPEDRRGTDRFTFSARYRGPTYGGYYRVSAFAGADASWSHAFTDRLSSVLTIADAFGPARIRTSTYSGTTFSREASRIGGPRVTFSLTYALGRRPAR